MQLIRCELYQGSITAAHIKFAFRAYSGVSGPAFYSALTRPIVVDPTGQVALLHPTLLFDRAIGTAKAYVEHQSRSGLLPQLYGGQGMQFERCVPYQGMVAAVHVQLFHPELAEMLDDVSCSVIVRPAIVNQWGEVMFLAAVDAVDRALSVAMAHIEHHNRLWVAQMLADGISAAGAIENCVEWGIPFDLLPPSLIDHAHY